jgi:hypothetical protein
MHSKPLTAMDHRVIDPTADAKRRGWGRLWRRLWRALSGPLGPIRTHFPWTQFQKNWMKIFLVHTRGKMAPMGPNGSGPRQKTKDLIFTFSLATGFLHRPRDYLISGVAGKDRSGSCFTGAQTLGAQSGAPRRGQHRASGWRPAGLRGSEQDSCAVPVDARVVPQRGK